MATVREIITSAMRRLSVLPSGETVSAVDLGDGLENLNDMVAAWNGQDIYTGIGTLTLDDEFPLDDRHLGAVKCMLAEYIASDFGAEVPANVKSIAFMGKQLLKADYNGIEALRVDDGLARMPSQRFWR